MSNNRDLEMKDIDQQIAELQRKKKMKKKDCTHKKKNGKWNLSATNNSGTVYRCKNCQSEFSIEPIRSAELGEAVQTVNDAIQQIKLHSKDEDKALIASMSMIAFNMEAIVDYYGRVNRKYGKGSKKNDYEKYESDMDGGYGFSSVSFTKKKKKK